MKASLAALIWERAGHRCEYCQLHQDDEIFNTFHIEHIIAKKHAGPTEEENLCLSCAHCNLFKGPNLTGIHRGRIYLLFNPRKQNWHRHFYWEQTVLVGKTFTGVVTVEVPGINESKRVEQREDLLFEGRFPPKDG